MSKKQRGGIRANKARYKSLKITLIYLAFGCIWIVLSDTLTVNFTAANSGIETISIVKGLLYVAITAILVYRLIYSVLKELVISEEKLKESEILFRTIFEQSPIGIAISHSCEDTNENSEYNANINPMFAQITGWTKKDLLKSGWSRITHPEDLISDMRAFKKLQSGEINNYTMEKRYVKPDGSFVWVNMVVTRLNVDKNLKCNHLCLIQDITERKSMEIALRESERSKSVLLSNLPGMAYRCNYDREWTMQFVSEGCFALTGYTSESLIHNKELCFNDLITPEYRELLWQEWDRITHQKQPFKYEYEIITATGQRKWVLEMGQGIFDEYGKVEALEGIIIDITERKKYELRLKQINEVDNLTGLHNRRYLENILLNDSADTTKGNRAIALICLRKINSISLAYGYNFTEQMIKEIAIILKTLTDQNHMLFQISLERFAFYIDEYKGKDELRDFCNSIINTLGKILLLHTVGCGIGIVEINEHSSDADSIIKNASTAAERVGENQVFGYCFFDNELKAKVMRETALKEELIKAAYDNNDESIYLQYQPILDLKTDRVKGFEALARFKNDKLGIVPPNEFIPIAEETQHIVPIGKKILQMACSFIKKLEALGYGYIKISVNISSIQLLRDEFIDDFIYILKEYQINGKNIGLEITETILAENYLVINEKLKILMEMGMEISIDDFGTGYSSLARERELNINCLKIDKSFIDKLISFNPDESITGDIISMAHRLGHCVVAEGVEHETQKQYLLKHNCDMMQGYLFSKPLDEHNAIEILKSQL